MRSRALIITVAMLALAGVMLFTVSCKTKTVDPSTQLFPTGTAGTPIQQDGQAGKGEATTPAKTVKPTESPAPAASPSKHAPPTQAEIAAARQAGTRRATIKTDKGTIVVELYGKEAPMTVANFVKLARAKFYDGQTFHRVVPDFVIQGGDPQGDGSGGPGYSIKMEKSPKLKHVLGALAMARSADLDSAGSQFYITTADNASTQNLDNPESPYAVFGKTVSGLDVAKKIQQGDKIISITVK